MKDTAKWKKLIKIRRDIEFLGILFFITSFGILERFQLVHKTKKLRDFFTVWVCTVNYNSKVCWKWRNKRSLRRLLSVFNQQDCRWLRMNRTEQKAVAYSSGRFVLNKKNISDLFNIAHKSSRDWKFVNETTTKQRKKSEKRKKNFAKTRKGTESLFLDEC